MTIPYYFTSEARACGESLEIGDYVRLIGLDDKYVLVAIIWRRGSVRIRRIGRTDQLYLPWYHIRPWDEDPLK